MTTCLRCERRNLLKLLDFEEAVAGGVLKEHHLHRGHDDLGLCGTLWDWEFGTLGVVAFDLIQIDSRLQHVERAGRVEQVEQQHKQ